MADEIAPWFNDAVIEGLQMLQVLSLPGTPPVETIGYASDVWVLTLWNASVVWDETVDRPRIARAFGAIARQAERWPAPKHVLDNLPPRPESRALPAPPLTREQIRANKARLAELLEQMRHRKHDAHVRCYLAHRSQQRVAPTSR